MELMIRPRRQCWIADLSSFSPAADEKVEKKQQGVIWGKSPNLFEGEKTRKLLWQLADLVELHSTVDPEDVKRR